MKLSTLLKLHRCHITHHNSVHHFNLCRRGIHWQTQVSHRNHLACPWSQGTLARTARGSSTGGCNGFAGAPTGEVQEGVRQGIVCLSGDGVVVAEEAVEDKSHVRCVSHHAFHCQVLQKIKFDLNHLHFIRHWC
ncbi:hypothetical protein CEXT_628161 [Caerostris extrusa]|uniref:Uncharacterized protein n=1 Tax=Caerostris extrusa TaxID=172846 RepID=A0AAV4YGR3_CAEEX|nr:hypothetical protein CEXT_628161 [Caerostris extrusa]